MTLYLAGPITGYDEHRAAFDDAKAIVAALGHEPISPLDLYPGDNWELAMQADIPVLMRSDGIVLLPGWPKSKGAELELKLAIAFDKRVFSLIEGALYDVTEPARANRRLQL